ncbi:MAG: hypothetical protein SPL48_05475, partial [Bacteroidales bacterium]|nr:hypothetical protein [Bacteroidales bacterium]
WLMIFSQLVPLPEAKTAILTMGFKFCRYISHCKGSEESENDQHAAAPLCTYTCFSGASTALYVLFPMVDHAMNEFRRTGLGTLVDGRLDLRCALYGYQHGDIMLARR